jgi:hypothetical protein
MSVQTAGGIGQAQYQQQIEEMSNKAITALDNLFKNEYLYNHQRIERKEELPKGTDLATFDLMSGQKVMIRTKYLYDKAVLSNIAKLIAGLNQQEKLNYFHTFKNAEVKVKDKGQLFQGSLLACDKNFMESGSLQKSQLFQTVVYCAVMGSL